QKHLSSVQNSTLGQHLSSDSSSARKAIPTGATAAAVGAAKAGAGIDGAPRPLGYEAANDALERAGTNRLGHSAVIRVVGIPAQAGLLPRWLLGSRVRSYAVAEVIVGMLIAIVASYLIRPDDPLLQQTEFPWIWVI